MHTIHRILRSARITMMVAMFGLATTASASAQTVLFSESFDGAWSTCNFDLQTGGQYWTSIGTGDNEAHKWGNIAGWTSGTGVVPPAGALGTSGSINFNTRHAANGSLSTVQTPYIGIFLNPGPRSLSFYKNGTDSLRVSITFDGNNYLPVLQVGPVATWTRFRANLGMAGFSSMAVRFEAVAANGVVNVGVDEVVVQHGLAGDLIEVGSDQPELRILTDVAALIDSASVLLANTRFVLNDTYNGIDTELLPLILVSPPSSGGPCTLTIGPKAGVNMLTTSGSSPSAVIKLDGADYVVLDGRPGGVGTSAWTISNTNTAGATAAVWLSSRGTGQGAIHNTLRNLTLSCGADPRASNAETFGIISSGASIGNSNDGLDNDFNTYQNNVVRRARWGLYVRGSLANPNDNLTIADNLVGPASFGPDQIGRGGIVAQHQNAATISGNEVRYVGGLLSDTAPGVDAIGIGAGANTWPPAASLMTSSVVSRNHVHDVVNEKGFSAVGIVLASSAGSSNNTVDNNMVRAVRANGIAGDQAVGIGIGAGSGDQVVFNSIRLDGDLDGPGTATATQSGVGVRVASTLATNLTLRNNAISVGYTSNTGTLRHFTIVVPSAAYAYGTGGSSHNDLWPAPPSTQATLGGLGTAVPYTPVTTLGAWRTTFTPNQDASSISEAPPFVSSSNLHLLTNVPTKLESGGTSIGGVTYDYDAENRLVRPDIGADEGNFIRLNDPPVIRDIGDVVLRPNESVLVTPIYSDPDKDVPLTLTATGLEPGDDFDPANGRLTLKGPACAGGTRSSVTIRVTDPYGASAATTFAIHIRYLITGTCYVPPAWVPKLFDYPADANANFVEDQLEQPGLRARGMRSGPVDSMIVALLRNSCLTEEDRDSIEAHGRIVQEPIHISATFVKTVPAEFLPLAGMSFTSMVAVKHTFRQALDTSTRVLRVRSSADYSPATVQDSLIGMDGSGVVVAILDSGVDDGVHESLPDSATRYGISFVSGTGDSTSGNPDDLDGHGTFNAGIVLGRGGAGGANRGLAPAASMVDVAILAPDGMGGLVGTEIDVIAGLEWVMDTFGPGTVVYLGIEGDNLAYGADASILWNGLDLLSETITSLTQTGLIVVVPIGNTDLVGTGLLPPAVAEDAIVVAATAHMGTVTRDDDVIASFSKTGPRESDGDGDAIDEEIPHVAAPGTDLPSGGTGIVSAQFNTSNQYVAGEGTSAAAAHVAGVVALMQQLTHGELNAQAMRAMLELYADRPAAPSPRGPWYQLEADFEPATGHGQVDAFTTLDKLTPDANLGFDTFCYMPGVFWPMSPDIVFLDPIFLGDSVRVEVHLHNKGGRAAFDYKVRLGAYNFGNSPGQGDFHTFAPTDTLLPGEYQVFTTKWYVNPGINENHGCLKAHVDYGRDSNPSDNCVQRNLNIENFGSTGPAALLSQPSSAGARFTMWVANLLPENVTVTLNPTVVAGAGTITSSESTFVFPMAKNEVPRKVTFDVTPTLDSCVVDVMITEQGACAAYETGGGRLIARRSSAAGIEHEVDLRPTLVMAPRPFSNVLDIAFTVPRAGRAGVHIFDVSGRQVRSIDLGAQRAGVVRTKWDGRMNGGGSAAPGVYFVRVRAGDLQLTGRVVRLQ